MPVIPIMLVLNKPSSLKSPWCLLFLCHKHSSIRSLNGWKLPVIQISVQMSPLQRGFSYPPSLLLLIINEVWGLSIMNENEQLLGENNGETQTKSRGTLFIIAKMGAGRSVWAEGMGESELWCIYSLEFHVAIKMVSDIQQKTTT